MFKLLLAKAGELEVVGKATAEVGDPSSGLTKKDQEHLVVPEDLLSASAFLGLR